MLCDRVLLHLCRLDLVMDDRCIFGKVAGALVQVLGWLKDIYRVPTGQGKLETVGEFEWSGKGQGKQFFGKVSENGKLVSPDVRFSG